MKVFVTGGTGFVGAHLVRHLVESGDEVICLARSTSRLDNLKGLPVKVVFGDICQLGTLRPAMKGCRRVFHCAADYRMWCKDPGVMHGINLQGTRNVMQAAWDENVDRVVYTSTVGCLGIRPDGTPAQETAAVKLDDLVGHYKRSKFQAEQEAENWARKGLPVVIVNPSTPVGDLDIKPTPTGKMIIDFLRGKMFAYVETGLNLIDVRDAAQGHLLAAEKGRAGEKYILGNRNLTLKAIFDILSNLTGILAPSICVPNWIASSYARIENIWSIRIRHHEPEVPLEAVKLARHKMWFDSTKAQQELGLPQSPVEQALERAVDWFRIHDYVKR
jgi:dihydroflavonol-4-reductase